MKHAGVSTMLALELLGRKAHEAGDAATLAVCCEAWERGGWGIQWFNVAPANTILGARYRKNQAKLRHQADALLAVIPLLPINERGWQHLKWDAELRQVAPRSAT